MTRDRSLATSTFTTLGLYATTHAAVDAVCAIVLWRAVHAGLIAAGAAFTAFLVYNLLALGGGDDRRPAAPGGVRLRAHLPGALHRRGAGARRLGAAALRHSTDDIGGGGGGALVWAW
jgi:hypothetical protein